MPTNNFLFKAAIYPILGLIALYAVILSLFTLPAIQREALFVHRIRVPFFVKYDNPERYGLAPHKTRNIYLNTSDGETIGAWHVLPRSSYLAASATPPTSPLPDTVFEKALADRPTLIYFHGNAGTRAAYHRVRGYSAFSNTLDVNTLVIDYRGFGDSTGTPSEPGLLLDARAAWDYLTTPTGSSTYRSAPAVPAENIILAGQSLGTAVVSGLAGALAQEGVHPRALVLIAPFSSLHELLLDYTLFWVIPLLKPLKVFPGLQQRLLSTMEANFDSATRLQQTKSPTLILCAKDDAIIPHFHSQTLFNHLSSDYNRTQKGSLAVHETNHPGWGRISHFDREAGQGGKVLWWEGLAGGHNNLGWAEGTIDLIKHIAGL